MKERANQKKCKCLLIIAIKLLSMAVYFFLGLNLPNSVEELCSNIPSLEKLMEEIVELAESGIRYTQMPHVMEVVLPMLCSYMSHWWEHGPENNLDKSEMCCTALTSEHMNTLLGNILKIIHNNLGIDEGAWMKRLAGKIFRHLYTLLDLFSFFDFCFKCLGIELKENSLYIEIRIEIILASTFYLT